MTQTLPFDIPLDDVDAPRAKAPKAVGPVTARTAAPSKGKSAHAFKTISEVAEELDVPAHVLRFWESKFSQISPLKRGGGRRYYRPNDVALIKGVRTLLYDKGLTIKGLQKVIREQGVKHVAAIGQGEAALVVEEASEAAAQSAPKSSAARPDLRATIARLEKLRDQLRS